MKNRYTWKPNRKDESPGFSLYSGKVKLGYYYQKNPHCFVFVSFLGYDFEGCSEDRLRETCLTYADGWFSRCGFQIAP